MIEKSQAEVVCDYHWNANLVEDWSLSISSWFTSWLENDVIRMESPQCFQMMICYDFQTSSYMQYMGMVSQL
jgi:hypothetical protein